jgi:hypothetical protein
MIALDWDPSARKLRQFAAVAGVLLGWMALAAHLRGESSLRQALPLALALAVAAVASVRPKALRLPFIALSYAVYPIGFVVSNAVLLVVFYGVITPLGAMARWMAADPLNLRGAPGVQTYWRERRRGREKTSYLRQA